MLRPGDFRNLERNVAGSISRYDRTSSLRKQQWGRRASGEWERVADPKQLQSPDLPCRPLFSMAIATPRCARTTASGYSTSPPTRRVQRRSFADECPAGMLIPVPSLPTRAGGQFPNIGAFTVPATHGREAVPPAPTPIPEDRTRRGKCCGSSSRIGCRTVGHPRATFRDRAREPDGAGAIRVHRLRGRPAARSRCPQVDR